MESINIYTLIDNIKKIATSLNELNHKYIIQEDSNFKKLDFDNAQNLLTNLENLIITTTHETSSTLDFMLQDLENFVKYIEFRQRHHKLNESDLALIIDHNPSIMEKKMVLDNLSLKNQGQWKEGLTYFNHVQSEWNKLFSNKSFEQIQTIISKW